MTAISPRAGPVAAFAARDLKVRLSLGLEVFTPGTSITVNAEGVYDHPLQAAERSANLLLLLEERHELNIVVSNDDAVKQPVRLQLKEL